MSMLLTVVASLFLGPLGYVLFSTSKRARLLRISATCALQVTLSRFLNGPKKRTWSWLFEFGFEFLQAGKVPQTVEHMRKRTQKEFNLVKHPHHVKKTAITAVRNGKTLTGFSLIPDNCTSDATVLYIHGGAYCFCSAASHLPVTTRIADISECRVITIDYRLAPEDPYPAGLDDCQDWYDWLLSSDAGDLQTTADKIVFMGDSAGGGMSLALLAKLRDSKSHPLPRAAVLLSPWSDLKNDTPSWKDHTDYIDIEKVPFDPAAMYAGTHALDHPLVSPVNSSMHGLPPMLVLTGECEALYDDNRILVEKMNAADVDVKWIVATDMIHVYPAFVWLGDKRSEEAFDTIAEFTWQQVDNRKAGSKL
eukprot:GFYU01000709.1.p1 GENE.GFYU01000709.1~~GFYU01000709.1.p1  ORF type:complete len:380 (+),score=83.15 GFYU01000709.1:50-1141(+)